MKLKNKTRLGLMALASGFVLHGCATEPDITEDPDFGQSVRQMIAIQTGMPSDSPPSLDGERAAGIMKEYRKTFAERQMEMNKSKAPTITFGSSQ